MKSLVIQGGKPLSGEITISGAKNSVVALIPAALIAEEPVVIEGVPDIQDVHDLIAIMQDFNVAVDFADGVLTLDASQAMSVAMPSGKVKNLRASYYFMGATLSRFGQGVIGIPGGCFLGPRPIDQHIKGFEALGAAVTQEFGAVYLTSDHGLVGTRVYLDVVSIGATINCILAAVKATGKTVIENAACEPEIVDLVTMLNKMGANIRGAGTSVIRIEGVERLHGCTHTVIPDRIEAGTYLALAAACGNGVLVKNVISEHIESFLAKLEEIGVALDYHDDAIYVHPATRLKAVSLKTQPYPGFATDLQQPLTPLILLGQGNGTIIDTIYPQRVKHIPELIRMGAQARVEGEMIHLTGPTQFKGTEVTASDLRAGACLVIAGLIAEGETTIYGVGNILRGYDSIVEKLTAIGASIQMVDDEE